MFPKAYMGIHAGDPESYDTFQDIYQPCIEGYHVGFQWDGGHAQQTDLNPENLAVHLTPEARALVASTRIRLARNLGAPYIMNPNGSAESRIDVLNLVKRAVEKLDEDLKGRVIEHASMTEDEEKALIADHFLFRGRDQRQAACGYHEYWPHGRGIFQARDKQFNMWINEGDHLRVMVLIPSADIEAVLSKLARGLAGIERCVASETQSTQPFASHPVLGIITCCPTNLGTGCRASVHECWYRAGSLICS
jgi:protein-arginine kinase